MNKLYTYISLLFCIVLMPGCLNFEEFEEPIQKTVRTFYAEMEAQPATKTVLGEKDAEGIRPVLWMLEDKIGVAPSSGAQTFFDVFVNKSTELADTATFEGQTAIAASYYAIYPYDDKAAALSDSLVFTLNSTQTYKAGSFDQGAFPMVARTSDSDENGFQFHNLCGVLEINLTGVEKIKSLTFKAKRPVSGQFGVGMKYETYPEMTASASASNSVTLNCGEGVQLNETTPTPFYLVLPPAEYETFELIITTTDGKMMRKQSQKPLNIKRSYVIEAGTLPYVEAEAIDLSLHGTANCYIVPSAGAYKFNASVIGNGEYGFVPDAEFHTSDPNINPSLVEVLWETKGANVTAEKGEVVANVSLTEDGYVDFYATGVEGNALVAVMDADSTILWSWHIWATDQPEEQHYINSIGEFFVLDRNLGATRCDQGYGDEYKDSYGLIYQWGRKDPFAVNNFTYITWDLVSIYSTQDLLKQPRALSVAGGSLSSAANWTSDKIIDFWSDECKTIYDPCPLGYRVASSDVWCDFMQLSNVEKHLNYGVLVKYNQNESSWYPFTPYHESFGNWYRDENESLHLWTSSQELTTVDSRVTAESALTYNKTQRGFQITRFDDMHALSVRCMMDDGHVDAALPTVVIAGIDNITTDSVIILVDMQRKGGSEVTECGIIYGTTPGVSADNGTKLAATGEEYKVELTGLTEGTKYYAIAYGTNDFGTSYSKEVSFYTEFEGSVNLSQNGTSNCYVVSDAGSYIFDASVKGNSFESVGSPVMAEVLWETNGTTPADTEEIIRNVQFSDGYVTFASTGIEGNALITVKDADGTILWSWHIWVTDIPSNLSYINENGQYTLLDRNLGATRANPGTADQWKESIGTLYQWGRKDPLVADIYARNTSIRTIESGVQYPTDHASLTSWNYASHWEKNHDNYLWRRDVKTIYDPCPPGYTVADIDVYYGIVAETASNGFNVKFDETTSSWFPVTPIIWCGGSYIEASDESIVWASCKTNNNSFYRLHLPCGDHEIWSCYDNAAMASPVRCMKIQGLNVSLQTSPATNISEISAKVNGLMKFLTNEADVTEMGFVWSDSNATPDINCSKVSVEVGEGEFSAILTNLKAGTTYNVRAYANDAGKIVYGNIITFMTLLSGDIEKVPEDNYEWE